MSTLMESWPRRHRITVDEYYRMAQVGLLAPDARVELIEGEIIDTAPIGVDHNSVVIHLNHLFSRAAGDQALVEVQGVLRLGRWSEPQPDLALLAPREDFYRNAHPTPADTLLVVEVSDSTLGHDLDVKVPLYARHGIPEVWIVDLKHQTLRVYRSPQDGTYRDTEVLATPGTIAPAALPGLRISLAGIFKD